MLWLLTLLIVNSYADVTAWSNPRGTRYVDSAINKENVGRLGLHWRSQTCGPVVNSPSVVDGEVHVGDHVGCLTAFNEETGDILRRKNLAQDYNLPPRAYSRTTPAYADGLLVIGMSGTYGYVSASGGVYLMAINASTYELVWKRQISPFFRSLLTGNFLIHQGIIYFGLSSNEEAQPALSASVNQTYSCCQFSGVGLAYRLRDGQYLWGLPMIPPELTGPGKYSGAAIWSTPSTDGKYVYFSTGNLYANPESVEACLSLNPSNGSCYDPRVMYDSVVKVTMGEQGGQYVNHFRTGEADTWNALCMFKGLLPGCPEYASEDSDFGNAFMLALPDANGKQYGYIGQKSAVMWKIDTDTMKAVWLIKAGPAHMAGGFQYGSTMTDDGQIFGGNTNGGRVLHTMIDGTNITWGSYLRFNSDGKTKWEVAAPNAATVAGALTSTNNVVFGITSTGRMLSMANSDGSTLWSYDTYVPGSIAGCAVKDDKVFWGTGPSVNFIPGYVATPCPFYAFKVQPK